MIPAGSWHSQGETSLPSRAGRTGLRTRDIRETSRDEVSSAVSGRSGKSAGRFACGHHPDTGARMCDACADQACQSAAYGCTRSGPGLRGLRRDGGQYKADTRLREAGRGRPQPGRMPAAGGFPARGTAAPPGGCVRPGRPTVGCGGNGDAGTRAGQRAGQLPLRARRSPIALRHGPR